MADIYNVIPNVLAGLLAMTVASAALAQAPRSSLDIATSAGAPEFRDPKTGHVWTPETVGQDGRPLAGPDDKAFDPKAQNVPVKDFDQTVRGKPVGTVPVTAGPTVPIVAMDNATLKAVPGEGATFAAPIDNPVQKVEDPTFVAAPGRLNPANLGGYGSVGFPMIIVPMGFGTQGLPTGIAFTGRPYDEGRIIGYAYDYEQATTMRRPPPLLPPLPGAGN